MQLGQRFAKRSWIEDLGLLRGMARFEGPLRPQEQFAFAAAGLNGMERHAESVWSDVANSGTLRLNDAITHFLCAFNDTAYGPLDRLSGVDPYTKPNSDFGSMRNQLARVGVAVSASDQFTKALLVDLLSPTTWQALGAVGSHVFKDLAKPPA